jgi:hypothetical protein
VLLIPKFKEVKFGRTVISSIMFYLSKSVYSVLIP